MSNEISALRPNGPHHHYTITLIPGLYNVIPDECQKAMQDRVTITIARGNGEPAHRGWYYPAINSVSLSFEESFNRINLEPQQLTTFGILFNHPNEPTAVSLSSLATSARSFLPVGMYSMLAESLLLGHVGALANMKTLLRPLLGNVTSEQLDNHIRMSFLTAIPGFTTALQKLYTSGELAEIVIEYSSQQFINWKTQVMNMRTVTEGQSKIFMTREEGHLACIFAVQANAKEFKSDNYATTIEKRTKAYIANVGLYGDGTTRTFMTYLFSLAGLSHYHDFLPKCMRKIVYLSLQGCKDHADYPWAGYLINTLMEWNGMSLIRETNRILRSEQPRAFFLQKEYVNEIRNFLICYQREEHKATNQFCFSWYLNPAILDKVSQTKMRTLYSTTLKILKESRTMTNFKSNLIPDAIHSSAIERANNIVIEEVTQSEELPSDYLRLLHIRTTDGPSGSMFQNFEAMFTRYLQQQAGGQPQANAQQPPSG